MGVALHWTAKDGDPSLLMVAVLIGLVLVLAGAWAREQLRERPARKDYEERVVPMVARNCERAEQCRRMADRVGVLEEQLAMERKYRMVLSAAVIATFDATDRTPPPDLMKTAPMPPLHLVKDA